MAPQITLTLDLTPETIAVLQKLTEMFSGKTTPAASDDAETAKKEAKKPAKKADAKPAEAPKEDSKPTYSMTDVRAEALKLSKAGQQTKLKEIFAKYGAEKLSDISEEHYADLMADLEAANG
jgi:hypothetical protein